MASLEGKVAFITGCARGQGRAHAVRLAREGCDIIGVDICADIDTMDYSNATPDDLAETMRLVEAEDRRIVARQGDVRDFKRMQAIFDEGYAQFGRIDIVVANAGIIRLASEVDPEKEWDDIIGTNLKGPWITCRVAIAKMIEQGWGGSIVMTSSTAGLKGTGTMLAGGQAYASAKRGLVGLMQVLGQELAQHSIRVNTVHPTGVISGMTMNPVMADMIANAGPAVAAMQNALPIPILEPEEIANAVAFLVSDQARYITGVQFPVDAGFMLR